MRTSQLIASITIVLCFFSLQSCKKSSGWTPDPVPVQVVKPDTLGTGWTKKIIHGELFGDIFFNSPTTGYLTGSKTYSSVDGGNTWIAIQGSFQTANSFVTYNGNVFFTNFMNYVIKTFNAGATFEEFPIIGKASDIFFTGNSEGYCITMENNLYNTIDGGLSWTKVTTTGLPLTSDYNTLFILSASTGWIANPSAIYRMNGSFANWLPATINGGTTPYNFTSLYATSASTIYAGGNSELFKSTDGGINFSFIKKFNENSWTDVHFINDLEGYVSCARSIYKTVDGGLNWSKEVSLGQTILSEIHFTDANHGWACGDSTVLTFKQ